MYLVLLEIVRDVRVVGGKSPKLWWPSESKCSFTLSSSYWENGLRGKQTRTQDFDFPLDFYWEISHSLVILGGVDF